MQYVKMYITRSTYEMSDLFTNQQKLANTVLIVERLNNDITGINEVKWKGCSRITRDSYECNILMEKKTILEF